MIALALSKLFPPKASKLGRIHGVDDVLRLWDLRAGKLKTVAPEPPDAGVGRVWEWPDGRHRKPRRVK